MASFNIKKAKFSDLADVVFLLTEDVLGETRESLEDIESYKKAFLEIHESNDFEMYLMEKSEEVIGFYQIMFLPHLSFQGSKRAQVESVRIKKELRGQGLGEALMKHAIKISKERGCKIFQLTTNKKRLDTHRFYDRLGMSATHFGYKQYFEENE